VKDTAKSAQYETHDAGRVLGVFKFLFVGYFLVCGGPYGIEEIV
jgi:hypothetical protein